MASQRPAWFRLSSMNTMRASAPAPAPPPVPQRPPTAAPIVRPSIPIRPPLPPPPPTQTQEPAPPPPSPAVPPPPPPRASAPPPSPPPPRSPPVATTAPQTAAQPRSPVPPPPPRSPPVATTAPQTAAPPRSPVPPPPRSPPVATTAAPPRSPVPPPPRSPPAAAETPLRYPNATTTSPAAASAPRSPPGNKDAAPAPRSPPGIKDAAPPPAPPPRSPNATTTSPPPRSPVVAASPPPQIATTLKDSTNYPSMPTSPITKAAQGPSSMRNSPIPKHVSTVASSSQTLVNAKASTPVPLSPKTVETTPTVAPKAISHPPSPFTLPPAQINNDADAEKEEEPKIEQKTVLVQHTIDKPMKMPSPHKNNNNAVAAGKRDQPTRQEDKKLISNSHSGMRVITLAGENKGAVMDFISPSQNKSNYSTVGNLNNNNNNNIKNGTEEGKPKNEAKKTNNRGMSAMHNSPPMNAYLNSNVQGVNNSILYNTAFKHNDPGVHLVLNRKTNKD